MLIRIALALMRARSAGRQRKSSMIIEGQELPKIMPPSKPDDGVQQVLKPEPGRRDWPRAGSGLLQLKQSSVFSHQQDIRGG